MKLAKGKMEYSQIFGYAIIHIWATNYQKYKSKKKLENILRQIKKYKIQKLIGCRRCSTE
jgi:hypothetical protein